jgi:hypothetical protein
MLVRSVDAGAAVMLVGHAVDHRGAGKHGGDPASGVDWVQACICLTGAREERRLRQRQRMLLFAEVEVVPHGRGKRATWLDRDWQPHLYPRLNTFSMAS